MWLNLALYSYKLRFHKGWTVLWTFIWPEIIDFMGPHIESWVDIVWLAFSLSFGSPLENWSMFYMCIMTIVYQFADWYLIWFVCLISRTDARADSRWWYITRIWGRMMETRWVVWKLWLVPRCKTLKSAFLRFLACYYHETCWTQRILECRITPRLFLGSLKSSLLVFIDHLVW